MIHSYSILFSVLLLCACHTAPSKTQPTTTASNTHNCDTAAGYVWSTFKNSCVLPYEAGITLLPIDVTLDPRQAAFLIFNEDETQAEVFIPGREGSFILERKGQEGGYTWVSGKLTVFAWKGYVLQESGKTLYHGDKF